MGRLEAEMSQHHPVDPTLCAAEPASDRLDDGFSPPVDVDHEAAAEPADPAAPQPALGNKSPF
jgi:hypothetical protein